MGTSHDTLEIIIVISHRYYFPQPKQFTDLTSRIADLQEEEKRREEEHKRREEELERELKEKEAQLQHRIDLHVKKVCIVAYNLQLAFMSWISHPAFLFHSSKDILSLFGFLIFLYIIIVTMITVTLFHRYCYHS